MRRVRHFLFAAALASVGPASAQIIPWSEPPALAEEPSGPPPLRPRTSRRAEKVSPQEVASKLPLPVSDDSLVATLVRALSLTDTLLLTSFDATVGAGSVRASTTWLGQVTQNAGSITVAGTAGDDNGWGATGLSLDAAPFTYLNITAQRDAGNLAPTLFIQFEDRFVRTKVYSLSTALFAVGTPTTVQIPLAAWTIDFGASDLVSWSIGGGSVGTVPFRLTFDDLAFTTSAIPEPATTAALFAALSLAIAWRRRVAFVRRRRRPDRL